LRLTAPSSLPAPALSGDIVASAAPRALTEQSFQVASESADPFFVPSPAPASHLVTAQGPGMHPRPPILRAPSLLQPKRNDDDQVPRPLNQPVPVRPRPQRFHAKEELPALPNQALPNQALPGRPRLQQTGTDELPPPLNQPVPLPRRIPLNARK
jgi:hypothetical protein